MASAWASHSRRKAAWGVSDIPLPRHGRLVSSGIERHVRNDKALPSRSDACCHAVRHGDDRRPRPGLRIGVNLHHASTRHLTLDADGFAVFFRQAAEDHRPVAACILCIRRASAKRQSGDDQKGKRNLLFLSFARRAHRGPCHQRPLLDRAAGMTQWERRLAACPHFTRCRRAIRCPNRRRAAGRQDRHRQDCPVHL